MSRWRSRSCASLIWRLRRLARTRTPSRVWRRERPRTRRLKRPVPGEWHEIVVWTLFSPSDTWTSLASPWMLFVRNFWGGCSEFAASTTESVMLKSCSWPVWLHCPVYWLGLAWITKQNDRWSWRHQQLIAINDWSQSKAPPSVAQ